MCNNKNFKLCMSYASDLMSAANNGSGRCVRTGGFNVQGVAICQGSMLSLKLEPTIDIALA